MRDCRNVAFANHGGGGSRCTHAVRRDADLQGWVFARVNLHDDSADNLGIVLRDPEALRELRVDELGIIAVVGIYIAGGS
jgi:hypothetical protein